MSKLVSFKVLISSLARTFADAQEHLSWTQLVSLRNFFHEDGQVKSIKVKLPNQAEQAEDTNIDVNQEDNNTQDNFKEYNVPLLSIAPIHPLNIKEATIDFSVGISDISANSTLKDDPMLNFLNIEDRATRSYEGEIPQDLIVDMKTLKTSKVGSISVSMKIECSEVEDGYARLISKLSQLQGNWKK